MRLGILFLFTFSSLLLADESVPTLKMHVFAAAQTETIQPTPKHPGMKMHVFNKEPQQASASIAQQPKKKVQSGFDMDIQIGTGYQHDTFSWGVAAPSGSPDTLTEASWKQNMWGLNSEVLLSTPWDVVLKAHGGYAWTFDGSGNESSYLADGRSQPFSSVNSNASGSTAWDASIAIGYAFKFAEEDPVAQFNFTPLVGYQWSEQSLLLKNGVQTIPVFSPLASSLTNRYIAKWQGPWLGFDTDVLLMQQHQIYTTFSYHWVDYRAEGQWQQNSALQQPTSFKHQANAGGYLTSIGYRYLVNDLWSAHVEFDYQNWASAKGSEALFLSSGQTINSQLNKVKRESFGVNIGVRLAF